MSNIPRLRINRLVSSLNSTQKQCIKTLLDSGLNANASSTLKSFLGDVTIGDEEIKMLFTILAQPEIPKTNDDASHKELVQKTEKILIKHRKLQNNSKFIIRDDSGPLSKLQNAIGKDINDLPFKNIEKCEINTLTRNWAQLTFKLDEIDEEIKEEDDKLLAFNLKSFVKEIDQSNLLKKQLLKAQQKISKKKRIVMKDKTNNTNDTNTNKKKTSKQQQISNPKSHLMRQKYSQLIDLEQKFHELDLLLDNKQKELTNIVNDFGILTQDGKCHQEERWTNIFDNDITVGFLGQNAFNRYKNGLKRIGKMKREIKTRQKQLKVLTDQVTWKKIGKTRGRKSMRQRVLDYSKGKTRRNEKNAIKREKRDKNHKENEKTNEKKNAKKTDKKNGKDGNIFDFFVPQNIGFKRKSNQANIQINLKKAEKRKRMNNDTNNNNKNNNEKSEME